ncbi:MAG: hypothetical protein CMJ16_05595 [Peredibacter sp.]|nr:hypothetical protein [Peredibacter sp.]
MGWLILIVILWFLSTVYESVNNSTKERIEQKKKEQEAQTRLELEQLRKKLASASREASIEDNVPQKLTAPSIDLKPTKVSDVDTTETINIPSGKTPTVKKSELVTVSVKDGKRVYESALVSTLRSYGVECLWHMTHVDNVLSITRKGLVSHERAVPIKRVDISDPDVQRLRGGMDPIFSRKIKAYSPTYIKIRNPMLYRLKNDSESLCLIEIALDALDYHDVVFTDGNAASRDTKFYSNPNDLKYLPWDVLNSEYWSDFIDGKRKRCAEILVYPSIGARHITRIHCNSQDTLNSLYRMGVDKAVYSPRLFFG